MTSMEKVIFPVHPAFHERVVMKKDVMSWAVIAGIPPRLMEHFVRGRMIPDEIVRKRIAKALGEELTTEIVTDCDPLRGMEFREMAVRGGHYKVHTDYPTVLLKEGDMIRCDDQRWLKLSSVDEPEAGKILLHSGEVPVSRVSIDDHVIAAVINRERSDRDPLKPRTKNRIKKAVAREVFSGMEMGAERADVAEDIMSRLERIRDGE